MIYVFLCTFIFIFLSTRWYLKFRSYKRIIDKIPGPPSLPLLGHSLEIGGTAEHSWNYFQSLNREYYPLYKLWNGIVPVVELISPDDIEVILSSKNHLEKSRIYKWMERWLGTGLLTSQGLKWQYRRKLLTPAFHFDILRQFSRTIVEQSEILVENLRSECDKPFTIINPIIAQFTLHTICETAMGTRLDEKDATVKNYITAIYGMGQILIDRVTRSWLFFDTIYNLTSYKRTENKLIKILHSFSKSVIENRKKKFKNETFERKRRMALLDLLISAKNNGMTINDDGIREEVDTFMFEGHDTTSSGIIYALLVLSHYPDIQEKIYKEVAEFSKQFTFSDLQQMHYLEIVVKECLRLFPSVPLIARKTDSDINTPSGYTIPANTIVHVHIYGMHRHPKIYPEPEKFEPERFTPENSKGRHPFAFIPFSAGPRNCIGQKFAMMELKCAIASIVRNFVLLPIDDPKDVQFILHMVLKSRKDIKIRLKSRK